MRTDAKIGFAIGGVLLAVLTVYAIVVPRHSKKPANTTVTLVTPPAPAVSSEGSGSGTTTTPPLGAASDGGSAQAQPTTSVTPGNNVAGATTPGTTVGTKPGTTPGTTPNTDSGAAAGTVADNTHAQDGFHPVPDHNTVDHTAGHIVDDGIYTPGTAHPDHGTVHPAPNVTLPDDVDPPANTHFTVYTVKPGQTLSKIAYEVYGNSRFWVAIQRENKTLDPRHLQPGMKINLPDISPIQPGTEVVSDEHAVTPPMTVVHTPAHTAAVASDGHTYIVKSGDSLYGIAKRLLGSGRKADALYEMNKDTIGPDKSRLKLGMVLKLPEAATRTALAE